MDATLQQHPAEILLQRRGRRASLLEWCQHVLAYKNETPAAHHRLIIEVLERVTRGELRKVIILMPPGSAKSTYISVCFPPWYLCQHPHNLVLACSYSYNLIEGFGRQCRDLIELYEKDLGYKLSTTAAAAGDWRITKDDKRVLGGYFCAGVNAGIAGHRADLGFIDDFMGSEEEANSDTIRDKNYKWYRNDFVPRLKPHAARIIIANRRHEEDLVGKLLEEEGSEWYVVKLPMLAGDMDPLGRKPGERLWPEWFTDEMVIEAKKNPSTWAGLYQQEPSPEEGDYFKKDWIVPYHSLSELPKYLHYYVGTDYAYRKKQQNDKTCFLPAGVDDIDRLWILPDWFWDKCDTAVGVDALLDIGARYKPLCVWAGKEAITGSIGPFLTKRMWERGVYIPIEEFSEAPDKLQKAQSIKARMSQRKVMFPVFAPGWEEAYHQLLTFPNGRHDDFIDALAKLGQGLAKMTRGNRPPPQAPELVMRQFVPTLEWLKKSDAAQRRFAEMELIDK